MSNSNLGASPANNKSALRQPRTRPELTAVTIQRVEHLVIKASKEEGISTLLLDGIESRVAALEDAPVPGVTLRDHDARLRKVEDTLRGNGHDRDAA